MQTQLLFLLENDVNTKVFLISAAHEKGGVSWRETHVCVCVWVSGWVCMRGDVCGVGVCEKGCMCVGGCVHGLVE